MCSNLPYCPLIVIAVSNRLHCIGQQQYRAAIGQFTGITGISDFRFHGLRYTWANWLIQSGVPLSVLQDTGGRESTEMVPDTGFELVTFS
ncbi:TPA: tyrosine-type recombinase/integrase, partial [Morganella morganii]